MKINVCKTCDNAIGEWQMDETKCPHCGSTLDGNIDTYDTSKKSHKYGVKSEAWERCINYCSVCHEINRLSGPKTNFSTATKCENDDNVKHIFQFDSMAEMNHFYDLVILAKVDEISNLVVHPKYLLQREFSYNGKKQSAIYYEADFQYDEKDNDRKVVEDVKGGKATLTALSRLKHKLFTYKYGDIYDFRIVEK